jgi:hypothetical protein
VKLFTKDPLDAARDSKVNLTERLAVAAESVKERLKTARRLAVDGADDKALDVAEAEVRAAQDRVGTLTVAILEVENNIADLVAEKARLEDEKIRAATVLELEAIERDFTRAADDTVSSAKQLSDVATRMGTFLPDAVGLSIFAGSAASEIPANAAMLKTILRGYISGVVSGGGRATLPQQPAPAAFSDPPKPALVKVCAIKKIAHTVDGAVRTSPPGSHVELLPEVASRALTLGAVCELSDPRAKHFESQRSPYVPEISNCVGLDAESRAAVSAAADPTGGVVQPIRRSAPPGIADASRPTLQQVAAMRTLPPGFTEIDRGPPVTLSTPAGNPTPGQPPEDNDDE